MQVDEGDNTTTPKFENLSYGTLRRYQAFFNISDEEVKKDKTALINAVKNHFVNMDINTENVIETFISIEKDLNNEKNNSLRKSIRFQEKSMARFLDNFNNIK